MHKLYSQGAVLMKSRTTVTNIFSFLDIVAIFEIEKSCQFVRVLIATGIIDKVDTIYEDELTDVVLHQNKFTNLKYVNGEMKPQSRRTRLCDVGTNLQKITNAGLKHLRLHTLHACNNTKITNASLKHMMLHTLSCNGTITDEGIKHMTLHTLLVIDHKKI